MATKPEKSAKKDNAEANRKVRLERTLKAQPNNKQVIEALKTTRIHRKTPVTPIWSSSWIRIAKLYKEFNGRFDKDIMSSNSSVAIAALMAPPTHIFKHIPDVKRPFSLGNRAKNKYGEYVWA